jgi:hypothetical protein
MQAPPFSQRKTPPIETAKSQVEEEQRNKLRELRAEFQDLEAVYDKVRSGDTTVQLNAEYINKTRNDVAELVSQIEEGGDTVRHLLNVYEQMLQNPLFANPENEIDAQEQMHSLNLLEEQVRKIEFYVGVLTIPARVNDWLHEARPGYYIPFHAVFEDEVPEAEDRARILSYLVWSPKPIKGGIVDAANGLIYRYNEDPRRRLLNILLLLGTLIAATAAVLGACYLQISGWPFQTDNLSTFTAGWIAILVGVIVHVAVGSVKRTQSQGQLPSIASLGDLPLILDARSGQIIMKILLALIGLFGLAFASGVENVTPLNAFLIGYSLDSVVEIFSSGIEQRASVQASALKKQLGVTTE